MVLHTPCCARIIGALNQMIQIISNSNKDSSLTNFEELILICLQHVENSESFKLNYINT